MTMGTTVFDQIDWVDWYHRLQGEKADLQSEAITDTWVDDQCNVAIRILQSECPDLVGRWNGGLVDERTVAYVVTSMVARVAIWTLRHSETNSAYTYTDSAPQGTPPDLSPSPNLYVKASEKRLVNGNDGSGPIGTIGLGLDRIWGG